MEYLKEKLTKQDVSEISKAVTSVFGRKVGWSYEVNPHPESEEGWGSPTSLKHMVGKVPADYVDPDPEYSTLEILVTNSREYIDDDHHNYFNAYKENGEWIVK